MLQEKHMKNIQTALVVTREELVSDMLKNISDTTLDRATDTMKDISTINRVMEILGIHSENKAKRGRPAGQTVSVSKTEDTQTPAKKGRRKKNSFRLGEDLKGKRPVSVEFNGNKQEVSSFRELTKAICEMAFSLNPKAFMNLESVEDVNGSDHPYFSVSGSTAMNEPVEISSASGETCFVDIAKLAMNNMLFLRKMLKVLGISEEDISIIIDPNYERKPRTVNKGTDA